MLWIINQKKINQWLLHLITQIQNLRYIGMCDDLITKYFGDTINYPLDMLTLETEEKVEPNQKTLEIS